MMETECVDDNFEMLMTVFVFVTNILYILTVVSGTTIQKIQPLLKFFHQHSKISANINLAPTSNKCCLRTLLVNWLSLNFSFFLFHSLWPLIWTSFNTFYHLASHFVSIQFLSFDFFQFNSMVRLTETGHTRFDMS